MPTTARSHFDDDIRRARLLLAHALTIPTTTTAGGELQAEVLRSCWMYSVGALDAYFCDAYTDLIAASIMCRIRQPAATVPGWLDDICCVPHPSRDSGAWKSAG